MDRKIIGAQYGKDAMRFMAQRRASADCAIKPSLGCTFIVGIDRNLDFGDHRFNFRSRFPQRFARFARDRICQHLGASPDDVDKPVQHFDPHCNRACGPLGPCCACSRDFFVDVANRSAPEFSASCRFVGNKFGGHWHPALVVGMWIYREELATRSASLISFTLDSFA
jgi:hypothetical protein